ncbi:uncharacterized protein [Typha latifolia]|uniref:uncharacterized protein n=1 Tax=Typha latifolia TaxID=4733 RepID=UPI003C303A0D
MRSTRSYQELDVESLWTKANELEEQFAAYKLRAEDKPTRVSYKADRISEMEANQRDSRGELYERYAQRRDSKLREEWLLRMEEKEAEMKAMWERLEQSRAEMAATFQRIESNHAAPRSSSAKRPSSYGRSMSSSKPRSSVSNIPKTAHSNSIRRRNQPETTPPTARDFSDTRKENRVPSSGVLARSRSTSTGDVNAVRNRKSVSHSRRNSTASSAEFEEMPKKQDEQIVLNEIQKSGAASKPFLRRGKGIGPGAGAAVAKLRASRVAETAVDDKDEQSPQKGGDLDSNSNDSDGGNSSSNEGSSDCIDPRSVLETKDDSSNHYSSAEKAGESSGGSSESWYSNVNTSFSNVPGIDALVDSPAVSPPSCEVDALEPRKKSGSAEKPVSASNSPVESHKDAAKGLRKLLHFGKRSKGTERTISATTTSLRDQDGYEHAHEIANWSSYDLETASNNPIDGHIISEQAHSSVISTATSTRNIEVSEDHPSGRSPKAHRSFFSFPFRNRGHESKHR